MTEIRRAQDFDAGWIADLIGVAFHPLQMARWLVPDPDRRRQILPAYFRILVDHALACGSIDVAAGRSAAAVWFPFVQPLPEPVDYYQRLAAACDEAASRFAVLDDLFYGHHPPGPPHGPPHHYLALLAVHPGYQGQGLGAALLCHYHAYLDQVVGMPAYLEARGVDSRKLFQRHGYRVRWGPFRLPGGTRVWPMWRWPARQLVEAGAQAVSGRSK